MTAPSPRRAFLHLVACVAIATAAALNEVWGFGPRQRRGAGSIEIQLDLQRIDTQIRILSDWFRRSQRHPRYSRREWRSILEYAERWGLSGAQIAREFLISPATAYRQIKRRKEEAGLPGPKIPAKPVPPCPRICDNRRQLVADMARHGFEYDRAISRHLQLHGEKISPRSVRRFRENPVGPWASPEKPSRKPASELPDLADASAAHLPGPDDVARPRLARLIRTLADAFAEGIAVNTLRRLDEGSLYETEEALLRTRRSEQLAILHSRFGRIPPRHRPRYTDSERREILTLKYRFRLSNKTLARWFLLDEGTLSDWNRDVDHPGERARPLVQPLPDRAAALAGVAGLLPPVPQRLKAKVGEALAAIVEKVPMRRRRKRTGRKADVSAPAHQASKTRDLSPILARCPNHYWSSDITTIALGRGFHLLAIVDLYSRDILAWDLFTATPEGDDVTALFNQAVSRHGKPKHFVSDQGGQFRDDGLAAAFDAHGVEHHEGAVGQHGAIAVIERLWRTAKEHLDLKTVRPNVPQLLRQRVAVVIDYYRTKRPHSALGNAAPAELYAGKTSRAADAKRAPRGWRGQACPPLPFQIRHAFEYEKKLPYLEHIA